MEATALDWVVEVLSARVIGAPEGKATSISTDSRHVEPGALFFALQGENSDGHVYVEKAFAAGAVAAVTSREIPGTECPLILVGDTLLALGDLAKHYRRRFTLPIVGVTGSVGKTSTKEMIAAVLKTRYHTLASEKNFNNEIGVPLTLFALTREHEAAVIEMGMRGAGQIDRLAEIAEPTIGVVTCIGFTHIELLGSRENIAAAKAELLERLPVNGTAILPLDDAYYEFLHERVPDGCEVLTFRSSQEPPPEGATSSNAPDEYVPVRPLSLRAPGSHHVANALAALKVAEALHVPADQAIKALEEWDGAEGRMEVRSSREGWTVLDDCYNASPESMRAALTTLRSLAAGRKIAVLGDMKELGDFGPDLHRSVALTVQEVAVDLLITVGPLAPLYVPTPSDEGQSPTVSGVRFIAFPDASAAARAIRSYVAAGDTILVKGSRAMRMEAITDALTCGQGADAHV